MSQILLPYKLALTYYVLISIQHFILSVSLGKSNKSVHPVIGKAPKQNLSIYTQKQFFCFPQSSDRSTLSVSDFGK